MNVEDFRNYCLAKKGVTESFPFNEETLVFKVLGKMFALCNLGKVPTQINLKCEPERSEVLRSQFEGKIIEGYHMNKRHWNTIFIETQIPESLITDLIDHSYELVVAKGTKKWRAKWKAL